MTAAPSLSDRPWRLVLALGGAFDSHRVSRQLSPLTPEIAAGVCEACRAGSGEIAGALTRALDSQFTVAAAEAGSYAADLPPAGFDGPGLVLLWSMDGIGLAVVLPEVSGMLPTWYADPDATGKGKLGVLAQELGMLVAPQSLPIEPLDARRADCLGDALVRGGVAAGTALVQLPITSGGQSGELSLIWPLSSPAAVFDLAAPDAADPKSKIAGAGNKGVGASDPARQGLDLSRLPHYSRSLLKIRIPVSVELATKKESVQDVVGLMPGTIIKFEKSCEELLQMVVGGQAIAQGEAVKVGDKFGFRVTSMVMPREHFVPVRRPREQASA
jgi:flagellar motor switch protein FliN/FliY